MKLIFEMGAPGRGCDLIPPCTTPEVTIKVPMRKKALHLPEVSRQNSAVTIRIWQNRHMELMMVFILLAPVP